MAVNTFFMKLNDYTRNISEIDFILNWKLTGSPDSGLRVHKTLKFIPSVG